MPNPRIEAAVDHVNVPNFFATLKEDTQTALGVVGNDYHIVQNHDAFSFFDAVVGGEGVFYETAGALGNGERIFIRAKLPGYIRIGNDHVIEKYLFLTNSHDGSGSITAAFNPVRVVCQNTRNAAMKNMSNVVPIRHTANAKERLSQAHLVMGMTNRFAEEIGHIFSQWSKVRITDKELKRLIEMAPNQQVLGNLRYAKLEALSIQLINTVESVYENALSSPRKNMETTQGTVFGAYNAVTG